VYIRGFYDTVPPRPSRVMLVSPNAGRSNPPRATVNGTKLYSDTAYGSHYRRVGPSGWEIEPSRRSPDFKGTLKWEKVPKSDIATIERMIASGRLILKSNPIDSTGRSGRSNPSHAPAYAGSLHKTNPSTKAKANALINLLGKLGYAAEIAYTSKATRGESYGYGLSRGAGTAAYYKVTSDASKSMQYVAEIVLDGTPKELEFVQVQYPNEYLSVTSKMGKKNPSSSAAEVFEMFHGEPSNKELVYRYEEHEHEHLAQIGPLVSLRFITPFGKEVTMLAPDPDGGDLSAVVQLCCSENRTQLYFTGGEQEIPREGLEKMGFAEGSNDFKDLMLLGVLCEVTYRTKKGFDKFKLTDYYHELGEETGVEPVLLYDLQSGLLRVAGGQYRIEDVGICN